MLKLLTSWCSNGRLAYHLTHIKTATGTCRILSFSCRPVVAGPTSCEVKPMSFVRRKGICVALAATVGMLVLGDASAQPQPQGGGQDSRGRGAEWMMGPGMMGASRFGFMCNPRHAGMAEWRLARIEAELKPNDAQTAALKELRAASTKAAEICGWPCWVRRSPSNAATTCA